MSNNSVLPLPSDHHLPKAFCGWKEVTGGWGWGNAYYKSSATGNLELASYLSNSTANWDQALPCTFIWSLISWQFISVLLLLFQYNLLLSPNGALNLVEDWRPVSFNSDLDRGNRKWTFGKFIWEGREIKTEGNPIVLQKCLKKLEQWWLKMTSYLAYKLSLVQHSVGQETASVSLPRKSAQVSEAEGKDAVVSKKRYYPGPSLPKVCVLRINVYNSYQWLCTFYMLKTVKHTKCIVISLTFLTAI